MYFLRISSIFLKLYGIIIFFNNGENDYNDVAFVISSNPIAAIEVPDVPNPGDRQGTEKYSGVLGFEDN